MHYTPFQTKTGNSLSCVCIHSAMRCLSTIAGMCAACASAVCNAMRFGRSSPTRAIADGESIPGDQQEVTPILGKFLFGHYSPGAAGEGV
jgi:hypothetical protein